MKTKPKQKKRLWLPFAIAAGGIVLLLVLAPIVVPAAGKRVTAPETARPGGRGAGGGGPVPGPPA